MLLEGLHDLQTTPSKLKSLNSFRRGTKHLKTPRAKSWCVQPKACHGHEVVPEKPRQAVLVTTCLQLLEVDSSSAAHNALPLATLTFRTSWKKPPASFMVADELPSATSRGGSFEDGIHSLEVLICSLAKAFDRPAFLLLRFQEHSPISQAL